MLMTSDSRESRPDFLLIGAMKAGTTSLFHDLNAQRGIYVPPDKEPTTLVHRVGDDEALAEYRELFRAASPGDLLGDASTGYAKLPEVDAGLAARAARLCAPDAKILYLVRNPVVRMLSHYHHFVSSGHYRGPLERGLVEIPHILDFSRYAYQLQPWLEAFGRERVRVVKFERYVKQRAEVLGEVCEFLGRDFDAARVSDEVHNASDGKPLVRGPLRRLQFSAPYRRLIRPLMSPQLRVRLTARFVPPAPSRPRYMPAEVFASIRPALEADGQRLAEMLDWPAPVFDLRRWVAEPDGGDAADSHSASDPALPPTVPPPAPARPASP